MMNFKQLSLVVAGSLALTSAFAGGTGPTYTHKGHNPDWSTGWYIGAGVNGDANMESNNYDVGSSVLLGEAVSTERSSNDPGFDIYAGRKVSDHFSFELGYSWMGDQTFETTLGDPAAPAALFKDSISQWNVHAVGLLHFPVGDYFSVFGKAGAAYYQNETTTKDMVSGVQVSSDNLHTFAMTYGAGAEVAWDWIGVRAEYTVVRPNDYDRDTFYISDVIGASVFFRFM